MTTQSMRPSEFGVDLLEGFLENEELEQLLRGCGGRWK